LEKIKKNLQRYRCRFGVIISTVSWTKTVKVWMYCILDSEGGREAVKGLQQQFTDKKII